MYAEQAQQQAISQALAGSVERVTFHNEENGFCVLRVHVKGQRDLVTVVGHAACISAGEYIECQGMWHNDRSHGLQFKAAKIKTVPPTTLAGIEKYLASGMVKGIGPHFAKVLVHAFGERVFDVIEQDSAKLLSLPGIGKKRVARITAAWQEQKVVRDIMVFLQSHGIGTARAVRIYKTYGEEAISKVRANPYCLALDIHGIGFKTADQLAQQLGVPKDSILRAQAGVRHQLQQASNDGHCALKYTDLREQTSQLLEIAEVIISDAIALEATEKNVMLEELDGQAHVFLAPLYYAECSVANSIKRLQQGALPWGTIAVDKAIAWVQQRSQITLSTSQQHALAEVLATKVAIITGGPGVGKTTIVNCVLQIVQQKQVRVMLAAPTGRAAKRLSESTQHAAKTIHRLLEFDAKTFRFRHNAEQPLATDLVIIDEASMLDIVLMHQLLKAIPSNAAVLLLGDVDQLPSVGPGAVLADLIQSQRVCTVALTEIFRQAQDSAIIVNAHRINAGKFPYQPDSTSTTLSDFYFLPADDNETILAKLLHLVTTRIAKRFAVDPVRDIQVLTPMNRSGLGARALNIELQQQLNPNNSGKITRFGTTFAAGDKVMQLVNNYDKDVFNGDIGFIQQLDVELGQLTINFDDRLVSYDVNELDELTLAYAVTIHKSQGSEYPVVIIPLAMQHYMMLAKNLLYTAVTRGKKLVVIIGQKKALAMAVNNCKSNKRITNLAARLADI